MGKPEEGPVNNQEDGAMSKASIQNMRWFAFLSVAIMAVGGGVRSTESAETGVSRALRSVGLYDE